MFAPDFALHHSDLPTAPSTHAGHNYIGTEHILLGLLREGEGVAARVLETLGADPSKIRTQVIRMVGESQEAVGAGVGGAGASGTNKMPTLEEYGTNLTTQAEEVSSAVQLAGSGSVLRSSRQSMHCEGSARVSAAGPLLETAVQTTAVQTTAVQMQQQYGGSWPVAAHSTEPLAVACHDVPQEPLGGMVAQQHHTLGRALLDSCQWASRTAAESNSSSAEPCRAAELTSETAPS